MEIVVYKGMTITKRENGNSALVYDASGELALCVAGDIKITATGTEDNTIQKAKNKIDHLLTAKNETKKTV